MIIVTRRNGTRLGLNPDLIERVDETPDTVVLLVTGSRYIIVESLEELAALIREWRGATLRASDPERLTRPATHPTASAGRAALRAIRTKGE